MLKHGFVFVIFLLSREPPPILVFLSKSQVKHWVCYRRQSGAGFYVNPAGPLKVVRVKVVLFFFIFARLR